MILQEQLSQEKVVQRTVFSFAVLFAFLGYFLWLSPLFSSSLDPAAMRILDLIASFMLLGAFSSRISFALRSAAIEELCITFGIGDTDPTQEGYPSRLRPLLAAGGIAEPRVENHGLPGERTAGGLTRIDSVLDRGGDFILIMEGTNDILSREVSVETISFNPV